jgi:EAL domain-containing protein (putative c-di-GMP-specific phosphodiesterase class I)
LPVDIIKIDRSFVSTLALDRRDTEIVRCVVRIAYSLDIDVVAEGVEGDVPRVRLLELGCESGQGFHFSHDSGPGSSSTSAARRAHPRRFPELLAYATK